jgi:PTS system nitrogen regulatory IIA component
MNRIVTLLAEERILLDLAPRSRRGLFETTARLFADRPGLTATTVAQGLEAREALGSTAIGQGIALPHARVAGLRQPLAAFLRLRLPIAFDAPDDKPVSLVLVLLMPERTTETHLQLLAEAAEMFCDRDFRSQLRERSDAAGVHRAFAEWRVVTWRAIAA